MSEDNYTFDKTDLKIASALEHKGLKIPTGDIPMDIPEASPLPERLRDSTALAMRIISMAQEDKQHKTLLFKKPTKLPDEVITYAMAARKGKGLSPENDAKIQAARDRIKKSRGK